MCVIRYFKPACKLRLMAGNEPNWLKKHNRREYIIASILSYPPWVDRKELKVLKDKRDEMTALMGERYHIDHYVPITHPDVCGLSVPWNMVVTPARCNLHKSNKWNPYQASIEFPPQLTLF